jgi:glycosyltransferase involved in cell wall biosynthesis
MASLATDIAKISIIIPALNEAGRIERAIASTRPSQNTEVITIDGGSSDNTRSIAENMGVTAPDAPIR